MDAYEAQNLVNELMSAIRASLFIMKTEFYKGTSSLRTNVREEQAEGWGVESIIIIAQPDLFAVIYRKYQ
jgi:hypothetical protein